MTKSDFLALRFPVAEIARLDELAAARGYSRSELVRLMLRRGIKYADDIPAKLTDHEVRTGRLAA